MNCPFNKDDKCNKEVGKCILAIFLTILGVAVALKIITLILCILPGSSYGNTWLVVVATIMVLFVAKYYKKGCCGADCDCSCHKDDKKTTTTKRKTTASKKETSSEDNSQK